MRTPMMAGNWKMNMTPAEAVDLASKIGKGAAGYDGVEQVICPPFVALPSVRAVLENTPVRLGAQNLHWEQSGAYTGEVSAPMLVGLVSHVIIGHSERRQYFHESDADVNKKIKAALSHDLIPIVCVGESLAQNEAGETSTVVSGQVRAALAGRSGAEVQLLIIAYEPIWAIGTGRAATAEQADATCGGVVRKAVRELYGDEVADSTRILYGGSTKPGNIAEIMAQPDIDGALIGGAALDAASYVDMVRITSDVYAA